MNVLTFDVEEWFHLLGCDSTASVARWDTYESRLDANVDRVLRLLDETGAQATFFVLGWIARRYPAAVRRIAEKYQIGCHTMEHRMVWKGSREDFRQDVDTGVKMLEDITGKKVDAFRAPGFSIRETEGWAFEILHELGIRYDASVFPAVHAHGGMPTFPIMEPALIQYNGVQMKEFPVSFKTIAGKHIIFNGGGYFRLFPYGLIRAWSRHQPYLLSYMHPRDLDAGQPMVPNLPLSRKFRSYVGLKTAESKLRRYLTDFDFIDIHQADALVDWSKATVFQL